MKFQHQLEKIGVSGKGEEDMKFICFKSIAGNTNYLNVNHIVDIVVYESDEVVYIYSSNDREALKVAKSTFEKDILPFLDIM
jgi:hypothetical protein